MTIDQFISVWCRAASHGFLALSFALTVRGLEGACEIAGLSEYAVHTPRWLACPAFCYSIDDRFQISADGFGRFASLFARRGWQRQHSGGEPMTR